MCSLECIKARKLCIMHRWKSRKKQRLCINVLKNLAENLAFSSFMIYTSHDELIYLSSISTRTLFQTKINDLLKNIPKKIIMWSKMVKYLQDMDRLDKISKNSFL